VWFKSGRVRVTGYPARLCIDVFDSALYGPASNIQHRLSRVTYVLNLAYFSFTGLCATSDANVTYDSG